MASGSDLGKGRGSGRRQAEKRMEPAVRSAWGKEAVGLR